MAHIMILLLVLGESCSVTAFTFSFPNCEGKRHYQIELPNYLIIIEQQMISITLFQAKSFFWGFHLSFGFFKSINIRKLLSSLPVYSVLELCKSSMERLHFHKLLGIWKQLFYTCLTKLFLFFLIARDPWKHRSQDNFTKLVRLCNWLWPLCNKLHIIQLYGGRKCDMWLHISRRGYEKPFCTSK